MPHPRNEAPAPWSNARRGTHGFTRRQARGILSRDKTCQLQLPGCTEQPTEADHIVGIADALAAGWDPADIDDETNGQAVCSNCHTQKTQGEIRRGLERVASRTRKRPTERHPGFA